MRVIVPCFSTCRPVRSQSNCSEAFRTRCFGVIEATWQLLASHDTKSASKETLFPLLSFVLQIELYGRFSDVE